MSSESNKKNLYTLAGSGAGLLLTLAISLIAVTAVILIVSDVPGQALYYFFIGPFTNGYYIGNMLNQAIPLIFAGLGISLAFKSSVFNLGGEGQVYSGALAATVVCLFAARMPGWAGKAVALVAAVCAGALLAGISGFFRMKWATDELITSFLLSSAVILVINYLITGPLDDPASSLISTAEIAEKFRLFPLFQPSRLDISLFFACLLAVVTYFFVQRTHWGYEMRICGLNHEFARYGGINVEMYLLAPMMISGGFHGLAGGVSILGTHFRLLKGATAGIGWNAIAVALIAKNNPLAVIPAALFFAYLNAGAKAAMLHSDVTYEIAAIAQSIIFYLVTARALYGLTAGKRERKAA